MVNNNNKLCSQCGAPVDAKASICKYCGADIVVQPQFSTQQQAPYYTSHKAPIYTQQQVYPPNNVDIYAKSKTVAGVLAIFLGAMGIHKFYLGHIGMGIVYMMFCWTCIPSIIGIVEGIIYLTSTDEQFYIKYVEK